MLQTALESAKAREGVLIVFDGFDGPSVAVQCTLQGAAAVPKLLRQIADDTDEQLPTDILQAMLSVEDDPPTN